MTRSLNVTPKTTLRSGKSEAQVTIIKEFARVIILLKLTTDGHKASRGLSATAELLVFFGVTNLRQSYKNVHIHADTSRAMFRPRDRNFAFNVGVSLTIAPRNLTL